MPRPLRERIHDIMFQHDSLAERAFDGTLVVSIVLSAVVVMLDSVASINARFGRELLLAEWFFTVLFTVEYLMRLWVSDRPLAYARSFYGIIDLCALLPSYLAIFFPAGRFFLALRVLRTLRVFRILKLAQYVEEASILSQALKASRHKIIVFITTVVTVVVVAGSVMYMVEGRDAGFTSIPMGIYWAIVTMTTVGYGDLAPQSPLGQMLSSVLMIVGYGILAVPTGIVTLEIQRASRGQRARECPGCGSRAQDEDASYCKYCGTKL